MAQPETLQPIDRTSIFLALTVGIPFATFKALCGVLALRNGYLAVAIPFFAVAGLDAALNTARIVQGLLRQKPRTEFCFLAQVGRFIGAAEILLALDTLLSFGIICWVLWSGWIVQLSDPERIAWLTATTINLLSVALVQIWVEVQRRRRKKKERTEVLRKEP